MDKKPDAKTLKLIEKHIKYLKKNFNQCKIILFGSRARREHLISSDVDLLVISDKLENLDFRERIIKLYGDWSKKEELDIIGLTNIEYEKRKNELSIIGRATKEGICI
jgi:predicted nucleotidyltransferase